MSRSIAFSARHAPLLCAFLFLAFGLMGALAAPARGEGLFLHPQGSPGLRVPAPIVAGTTDIVINGITGRATIRQTFLNPQDSWVEGVYVFPLPDDAAVYHMRLRVDDRTIEGRIEERQVARKKYKRAADSGKRASLLEQERPSLFTMSVANIPPKGRIEVEIGYQQAVTHLDGRYSLRFPMAVTPRYLPAPSEFTSVKSGKGNGERLKFLIRSVDAPRSNPMAVRVKLDPGMPLGVLESASHKLMVTEPKEGHYGITLASGAVATDRDFVLEWTLESLAQPEPTVFVEERDGAAYLLAMIVPPKTYRSNEAPQPREAIFVIDTSGSMHGESMRQARDALLFGLERLTDKDRFNIISFSSKPRRLFTESRIADTPSLDVARNFVRSLRSDGGTEIGLALSEAFLTSDDEKSLRQVILMTDGAVGNEPALLAQLRKVMGRSRLFTVAIGNAPNGYFMREAARIGRGAMLHISDIRQVRRQVSALFAKLERPVLTDITAAFPQPAATQSLPSPIPDLYHGEPIVMTARIPVVEGNLVLTGQAGSEKWRIVAVMTQARPGTGIAKLWARSMVDREMGRLREGVDRDKVRLAVLDLALRHKLLTDYTSLVAVDTQTARPKQEEMAERRIPANPPAGWTPPPSPMNKIMMKRDNNRGMLLRMAKTGPVPTVSLGVPTATPAFLLALFGILALLAGGLCWQLRRRIAP
jgi:Ca-activated chloride channel family protein